MRSHKHQCHVCGTVWEHGPESRGHREAHRCPRPGCFTVCFVPYEGPEDPTPAEVLNRVETIPATCMDCHARFRIPTLFVKKLNCPECFGTRVLDFNLSKPAFEKVVKLATAGGPRK